MLRENKTWLLILLIIVFMGITISCAENSKNTNTDTTSIDVTAPAAPEDLLAVSEKGQIILTWKAIVSADFEKFRIYRSTSSIPNDAAFTDKGYGQESGPSFTDTNVKLDSTYYYRITSVDKSGNESTKSNQVEVVCSNKEATPGAPVDLTATAGKGQIILTWKANTETDLDKYRIYRSTSPISNSAVFTEKGYVEESGITYTDTEIVIDTTYYYRISAVNKKGDESSKSNQVQVTCTDKEPPSKPKGLVASAGNKKGEVILTWTANTEADVRGYNIYDALQAGNTFTFVAVSTTATYTISGLNPGQTYYFSIAAVDTANNISDASDIIAGQAMGDTVAPAAPVGLTATAGSAKQIVLNWTANSESDIAKYVIYESIDGISYSKIDTITGTPPANTYTVTGLTTGNYYFFTITAIDSSDNESTKSSRSGLAAP